MNTALDSTLAALLLAAVLAPLAAVAQSEEAPKTPPPKPCTAPEYRQFDFWLGEWDVVNQQRQGARAATNRIRADHGGCVIREDYTNPGGYSGSSLSFYDAARGKWHQTWIDNQGEPLYLDGGFADGKMVLSGEAPDGTLNRITWTPRPDGSVQQLWDVSKDGGKTWQVGFDGLYTKKK